MRKTLAAATMAASITLGGAAGAALFAPAISGAETTDTPSDSPAVDDTLVHHRGEHFAAVLAPLVEDGTLTQAQADAVTTALEEAGPARGRGPHGRAFVGDAVSDTLGLTGEEIRSRLADGKSLADIAADEGIDVQSLIDAIVAEITEHVNEEVADGEITQEEADERLADVDEHVIDMVNASGEFRAGGPGRGPGGGPRHQDGDAESGANDAEETAA